MKADFNSDINSMNYFNAFRINYNYSKLYKLFRLNCLKALFKIFNVGADGA